MNYTRKYVRTSVVRSSAVHRIIRKSWRMNNRTTRTGNARPLRGDGLCCGDWFVRCFQRGQQRRRTISHRPDQVHFDTFVCYRKKALKAMKFYSAFSGLLLLEMVRGFSLHPHSASSLTALSMALDDGMVSRLDGIRRSYQALTERLGDPDVLEDSKLLQSCKK